MNQYSTEDILKHINQQTQPELYNAILTNAIDGEAIVTMETADVMLLCNNILKIKLQYNKLKATLEKLAEEKFNDNLFEVLSSMPIHLQESTSTTSTQKESTSTTSTQKETATNPSTQNKTLTTNKLQKVPRIASENWPTVFVFPAEKTSFALRSYLEDFNQPIETTDKSFLNEIVKLLYDAIVALKIEYPTCFEYETAARSVIVEYPRLSMTASIQNEIRQKLKKKFHDARRKVAKSELTAAMIRAKDKYAPKTKKPRSSKQPLEDLSNGNDSPVKDSPVKDSTMKDLTVDESD